MAPDVLIRLTQGGCLAILWCICFSRVAEESKKDQRVFCDVSGATDTTDVALSRQSKGRQDLFFGMFPNTEWDWKRSITSNLQLLNLQLLNLGKHWRRWCWGFGNKSEMSWNLCQLFLQVIFGLYCTIQTSLKVQSECRSAEGDCKTNCALGLVDECEICQLWAISAAANSVFVFCQMKFQILLGSFLWGGGQSQY